MTIGLVYRDLVAMNSANDSQHLLPDYMGPNSSVLSHRLMSVCDHVIHLTNEEIKRSVVHVDVVPVPTPNDKGPRARTGKACRKETQKGNIVQVSSPMAQSSGESRRMDRVSEERPIVLPKPRKRARGQGQVYDVDNDLVG